MKSMDEKKSLLGDQLINLVIASVVGALTAIYLTGFNPTEALKTQNYILIIYVLIGASLFAVMFVAILIFIFKFIRWITPYTIAFFYPVLLIMEILSRILSKITKYIPKKIKNKKKLNGILNKNWKIDISKKRQEKLIILVLYSFFFYYIYDKFDFNLRLYFSLIVLIALYEFLIGKDLISWKKYQKDK